MLEKINKHLVLSFSELDRIKKYMDLNPSNLNELKKIAYELNFLSCSPSSSMAIMFKEIHKEDTSYNYYDILNCFIYELKNNDFGVDVIELYNKLKEDKPKFLNAARIYFVKRFDYIFYSDVYNESLNVIKNSTSVTILKKTINNLLDRAIHIIEQEILVFLIFKTYTESPLLKSIIPSDNELRYYQKWIDNSITYNDLSSNTHYDINKYVLRQKLDFDIREQIDKKKEELFKEGVSRKLQGLINDLSEISKGKRIQTISTHKQLLKTFLQGDISQLLIKRLNVFLKITEPEKVILKYDKLLHSEYYNHYELNIFEPKKYREYSAVFNAHLIYEYLKVLNNPKTIPDDYEVEFEDTIVETTRLSFKFNSDISKLSDVIRTLQLKIELLKDDTKIEYLIDVLTSDDLSEFSDDIIIGCETKQFSYVLKSLHPYFNNLTMKSIQQCTLFKSKNKQIPITANNLYLKDDLLPKKSADIDIAINQMI